MNNEVVIKLYQAISEANEPRVFENFHASSIADCPRAHYYKRLGIKPLNIPSAAKMLRWDAGHIIESILRPHLLKLYPDLVSNKRLTSKKLDLTGEYDNYSEKEKMLIEVKSVHVNAPRYLEKEGAYLSHEYQNHAYVLLLQENASPIERIMYIYVTLDGRILAFDTKVQEKLLTNVEKRLSILRDASESGLPECLCKPEHPLWKPCMQYCDYRTKDGCCDEELVISRERGTL